MSQNMVTGTSEREVRSIIAVLQTNLVFRLQNSILASKTNNFVQVNMVHPNNEHK